MKLKAWQKFFIHFALFVFEKSFQYLHHYFDLVYDIDDDCISVIEKGSEFHEKSFSENS